MLLEFATQALTYIVPKPPVLRSMARSAISLYCSQVRESADSPNKPGNFIDASSPLYMLLGASHENLPLVAKYTYDLLSEMLEHRPDDQVSLALALYPDTYSARSLLRSSGYRGSRNNADFWREMREFNWGRLFNSIELQRTSRPWVETFLVEHQQATLSTFLAKFTVQDLYETGRAEEPPGDFIMPLVPRIWLSYLDFENSPKDATQATNDQIDQFRTALINQQTPWFASEDPDQLNGIVTYVMDIISTRSTGSGSIASFLFFAVTLIDLSGESIDRIRRTKLPRNEWAKELARIWRLRERGTSVNRVREKERLMKIGVDDMTADVLVRWISDRDFCLIRSARRPRHRNPVGPSPAR